TVLTGDVNCDGVVTASDISSLFAYVMNAGSLSEQALLNADIDGNGTVDATDASLLAQMVFGA
ncbi:MAG: dockerin type I repeat-containing protein, partial [Clostridia bacterium]|nr:dockerin type I repeat-containing protein [Clostridia bacterium]